MDQICMNRRGFVAGAAVGVAGAVACGNLTGVERARAEEEHADAVTNYYQCSEDWLGLPPETGEPAETYECDVLVLGGGHAGIHAALAAAEGGAKVIVVEKQCEETRHVNGVGIGHINSQWLIDQGFGPYDVGEVTREFVRRAGGRCNQEIIRKFLANSGEAVDHLLGLITWPNDRIKCMEWDKNPELPPNDPSQCLCQVNGAVEDGPVEYPIMCGGNGSYAAVIQFMGTIIHDLSAAGGVGASSRLDEVEQFAILAGQDLGAEWHFDERALKLTTDESGAVTGAISQKVDDEGVYVEYRASKGVILCTGDYSADHKMAWNLNTDIAEYNARQGKTQDDLMTFTANTGDGHKMACWAGGVMQPVPRASMYTSGGGGGPWGTCPFLWLDARGVRYCNEANAVGMIAASLNRPVGIIAAVMDANYYQTMKYAGLDHGAPNYGRPDYYAEIVEDMDAIEADNPEGGPVRSCTIAERDPSTVYKSDTLEGVLKLVGYEGEALQTALDEVARYNELCETGVDSQYGKDPIYMNPIVEPPFYACCKKNTRTCGTGLVTLAGLETDDDLRVLGPTGEVIPNLWCAGNCLGERFGNSYSTPFGGNSNGMAVTHGRIAGKLITGQPVL